MSYILPSSRETKRVLKNKVTTESKQSTEKNMFLLKRMNSESLIAPFIKESNCLRTILMVGFLFCFCQSYAQKGFMGKCNQIEFDVFGALYQQKYAVEYKRCMTKNFQISITGNILTKNDLIYDYGKKLLG
jgi:hypothetical protein